MYFFSNQEEASITNELSHISDSLRGWNLKKRYDRLKVLNISNLSSTFCVTDRKIYQIYKGINFGSSVDMIIGSSIHSIVEKIFESVFFVNHSNSGLDAFLDKIKDGKMLEQFIWNGGRLQELRNLCADESEFQMKLEDIKKAMRDIVDLEEKRLGDPSLKSRVAIADLERYVSGDSMNISTGKIDAIFKFNGKIGLGDLKTGRPWKDNRDAKLQITIYALLLEAEIKKKIDWGVVIFPYDTLNSTKKLRVTPLKDIFGIGDELRSAALTRPQSVNEMLVREDTPEICYRCRTRDICLVVS
jgi:CRISPR/Cas system-associated exonuclease Cas4 (RecB family)